MRKKIAAVIIENKKLLVVRDRGEDFFKMPGGKVDGGESAEECLQRELREELSVKANLGKFVLSAMGKRTNGDPIQIDFYFATYEGRLKPSNEIDELRFIASKEDVNLVKNIKEFLIPELVKKKLMD